MYSLIVLCAIVTLCPGTVHAQISRFPYVETFDDQAPPGLPAGWSSSSNRTAGQDDFVTASSSPASPPNALLSTNATVEQWVASGQLDFTGLVPDSLFLSVRRSASHGAPVVIECSSDGGATFVLILPDSVLPDGSTDYLHLAYPLPSALAHVARAVIRWRVIPVATGTAGTIRLDNVRVTALHQFDLGIESFSYDQAVQTINAVVYNAGTEDVDGFTLALFHDQDRDSVAELSELLGTTDHPGVLARRDSAIAMVPASPPGPGAHRMIGILSAVKDSNPFNDTLRTDLTFAYPVSSLVINELMYRPLGGGSEYIELYNPGTAAVNPVGWIVSDRPGADGEANEVTFPDSTPLLRPGSYLLIGTDSLIVRQFSSLPASVAVIPAGSLTLNNDGDCILLLDPVGTVVDSVPYEPEWHHTATLDETGRSLERISPFVAGWDRRNWSSCTRPEGGTPGTVNSIALNHTGATEPLTFSPNPFSPDGDGHEDFVLIQFVLPPGSYSFSLRLFDTEGRQIRQLAINEPAGSNGSLLWDGLDDYGQKARIGIYVALLEIHGGRGEVSEAMKGVVVLAGRL